MTRVFCQRRDERVAAIGVRAGQQPEEHRTGHHGGGGVHGGKRHRNRFLMAYLWSCRNPVHFLSLSTGP
jgi:hypothetical protein